MLLQRTVVNFVDGRRVVRLFGFKQHIQPEQFIHNCSEPVKPQSFIWIGQEIVCPYCHLILRPRESQMSYSVSVHGKDVPGKLVVACGTDKSSAVSEYFYWTRKVVFN